MNVAIIGATGFVGKPITAESLTHPDLAVMAVVRKVESLPTDASRGQLGPLFTTSWRARGPNQW
jgi:putative NADH-flavin reductase